MQSKKSAEAKAEKRTIEINDVVITRAKEGTRGVVFFDMILNGVSVYGMKVVAGKNGDFISWPSYQDKNDPEKYYNHAWAPLSEDQAKGLMMKVQDKLDE